MGVNGLRPRGAVGQLAGAGALLGEGRGLGWVFALPQRSGSPGRGDFCCEVYHCCFNSSLNPVSLPCASALQPRCPPGTASSSALTVSVCTYWNFPTLSLSLAQSRKNPACFPVATTLTFPPRPIPVDFPAQQSRDRGRGGSGLPRSSSCNCCGLTITLFPGCGGQAVRAGLAQHSPAPRILAHWFRRGAGGCSAQKSAHLCCCWRGGRQLEVSGISPTTSGASAPSCIPGTSTAGLQQLPSAAELAHPGRGVAGLLGRQLG